MRLAASGVVFDVKYRIPPLCLVPRTCLSSYDVDRRAAPIDKMGPAWHRYRIPH